MALFVVCPNCRSAQSVEDERRGKQTVCRLCASTFPVGFGPEPPETKESGAGEKRSGPAPRKTAPKERRPEAEGEKQPTSRPAKKRPAGIAGGRPPANRLVGAAAVLVGTAAIVGGYLYWTSKGPGTTGPLPGPRVQIPEQPAWPLSPDKSGASDKNPDLKDRPPAQPPSRDAIYKQLLRSVGWVVDRSAGGDRSATGTLVDRTNQLMITTYNMAAVKGDCWIYFPQLQKGKLLSHPEVYLELPEGKGPVRGRVVAADARRDLALVRLERLPPGVEPMPVARASIGVAASVHSIGNLPRSEKLWSFGAGTIREALAKEWTVPGIGEKIAHKARVVEAPLASLEGDSGGPLVNNAGELVGIKATYDKAESPETFIDLREITEFVGKHFPSVAAAWGREVSPDAPPTGAGDAQVSSLIKGLASADAQVRAGSAEALAAKGADARVAIPALLKALGDTDDLVRRMALKALAQTGPPARADVPLVADVLRSPDAQVRGYAVEVVTKLGPDARPALSALTVVLTKDADPVLRQGAARALGRVAAKAAGDVVPALVAAARDDAEKDVRVAAAEALTALESLTAAHASALVRVLEAPDPEVRARAARALGKIGPEAKQATGALAGRLRDKDKQVRQAVLEALAQFGPEAQEVLPDVRKAFKDPDLDVRRAAIDLVGMFGPEAKAMIPDLLESLKDLELRGNAVAALGKMGADASATAPTLASALKGADKPTRLQILAAVVAVKPSAQDQRIIVPRLVLMFEEKDRELTDGAVEALARLGRPAVTHLVVALGDLNPAIRAGAAAALGEIGPQAREAATALTICARRDPHEEVRTACTKALSRIR